MHIKTEIDALDAIKMLGGITSTLAVDTETTGLYRHQGDKLFAIIIGNDEFQYYFDFKVLGRPVMEALSKLFSDKSRSWVFFNAKFDLHMLDRERIIVSGTIYDNVFLEKIIFNQHFSYSMDSMAKRYGLQKSGSVLSYIKDHKLTKEVVNALGEVEKRPAFELVPDEIMAPYACNDVLVTYKLFSILLPKISEDQMAVVQNECKLLKTVFLMEKIGVKVDRDYCLKAREFYDGEMQRHKEEFERVTGLPFSKGPNTFKRVFAGESDKWTYTDKGNPEFDIQALSKFTNPAAKIVLNYAKTKKQHEYFTNFLYYSDENGVIHPNFKPDGPATNRFSCSEPNLQNLTKPDKYDKNRGSDPYPIRKALVPRDGKFFAMLDFSQMEYRVMLDIAKAEGLISKIKEGFDVHGATAELSGTTRGEAKTTNFLTLYGGGVSKLCMDLFQTNMGLEQLKSYWKSLNGWSLKPEDRHTLSTISVDNCNHDKPLLEKAKSIQDSIFRAAPEIKQFISDVSSIAEKRGYVRDFLGRRYHFPDKNFSYKAPNHLIQGGCATAMKIAMNEIDALLAPTKTRMILTIHDELVFEVDFSEKYLIPKIKEIMERAFPWKELPTEVEVDFSEKSLAEKEEFKDAS